MSRDFGSIRWGIILIVFGLAIILHATGIVDFGNVVGVLIGFLLVWWGYRSILRSRRDSSAEGHFTAFGDNVIEDASSRLDYSTVFGDTRIRITGAEFSRGTIKTVFGDLVVDLSGVERITEPGRLELDSVFGDVRLRLPQGLAYEIEGSSVFGTTTGPGGTKLQGGRHSSSDFDDAAANRLRIHISHVFGDNEITH